MILLLTPTEIESKYLKLPKPIVHLVCGIGKKAKEIENTLKYKNNIDLVILFGCCGLIHDLSFRKLYFVKEWFLNNKSIKIDINNNLFFIGLEFIDKGITTDRLIKTKNQKQEISNYNIVDLESFYIVELCQKYDLPCAVIRYGIDYCDKKIMPLGINHFYRKYIHRKMQRKMSLILEALSANFYGWTENEY